MQQEVEPEKCESVKKKELEEDKFDMTLSTSFKLYFSVEKLYISLQQERQQEKDFEDLM